MLTSMTSGMRGGAETQGSRSCVRNVADFPPW